MRMYLPRLFACVSIVLGVSACAMGGKISDHAVEYNKSVEEASNAQLILNILRAADRRPMHFTAISQIRGSLTLSSTGSLSITIPFGGDAASVFPLTPSISVTEKSSPSFDLAVLNSQEFVQGILSPIKMSTFNFYWDQGWPREVLLHLLFRKVDEKFNRPGTAIKCRPLEGARKPFINSPEFNAFKSFDGFVDWVRRVRDCDGQRLGIGSKRTGSPVGPAIDFAFPENLEALIKVAESEKELIFVSDVAEPSKQRLCKISRSVIFCQGACPKPDPEKILKKCAEPEKAAKTAGPEKRAGVQAIQSEKGGISGSIHLRSVQGILYYLGEILRHEREPNEPIKVRYGPEKKLVPLFQLTNNPDEARRPVISVTYGEKEYFVPAGESGQVTLTALALLNQLMGLHRKGKELPTTSAVETVGE